MTETPENQDSVPVDAKGESQGEPQAALDGNDASAWENMLDNQDAEPAAGASERILNQDEIDSLLGFDASADDQGERTGVRGLSHDRGRRSADSIRTSGR